LAARGQISQAHPNPEFQRQRLTISLVHFSGDAREPGELLHVLDESSRPICGGHKCSTPDVAITNPQRLN